MRSRAVCTPGSERKSESFNEYLPSPVGVSGMPARRDLAGAGRDEVHVRAVDEDRELAAHCAEREVAADPHLRGVASLHVERLAGADHLREAVGIRARVDDDLPEVGDAADHRAGDRERHDRHAVGRRAVLDDERAVDRPRR